MSTRRYFGTDGIRGIAGVTPLDPETTMRLGKAIAKVFLKTKGRHRILIGKDTRLSGYMLETALASGITSMGAEVLLVGPLPTPGVAYLTKSMRAEAGIVISASHNSFEDNGIKIFAANGFKLADEIESELESFLSKDLEVAEPSSIGKAVRIEDAIGRYTVYLKSNFPRELSLDGLKIGLDCANGAAYVVAPQTLSELGADVISRGISPNGKNINSGFGSLFPEVMSKLVLDQNLDIGITLDGDGDRCILVDEKGNILDGDVILAICALDLHERGLLTPNKIAATVMSNLGLDRLLNSKGIEVVRTAVGDRYVLETMLAENLKLGGEQSGHAIFLDQSTSGDGLLTALNVLSIMMRNDKKLSELASQFEKFPQTLINVKVSKKTPFEEVEELQALITKIESSIGDKGRVLIRYSGTENKARVMVEYEDAKKCEEYAETLAETIEKVLGV